MGLRARCSCLCGPYARARARARHHMRTTRYRSRARPSAPCARARPRTYALARLRARALAYPPQSSLAIASTQPISLQPGSARPVQRARAPPLLLRPSSRPRHRDGTLHVLCYLSICASLPHPPPLVTVISSIRACSQEHLASPQAQRGVYTPPPGPALPSFAPLSALVNLPPRALPPAAPLSLSPAE